MFEFVFSAAVDADCLPSEIKSAEAATGAVADCCFASEQDCLERPVRHLFHELSDLALVAVDAVGLVIRVAAPSETEPTAADIEIFDFFEFLENISGSLFSLVCFLVEPCILKKRQNFYENDLVSVYR